MLSARGFCLLIFGFVAVFAANHKATRNRASVGPCILHRCPDGFQCEDQECLPDMSKMEKIGQCVNLLCPDGYFCHNDSCLRPIPKKRVGSLPIGPCVNQHCPSKHMCDKEEDKCYPME